MKKKIGYGFLAILVVIQFFKPKPNENQERSQSSIFATQEVPANVKKILDKACMDCHSNNTMYPWYANIQPIGWWLQHHVNEAKGHLNFDAFANYPRDRAAHKMEEVWEEVEKGNMPLNSYTWMHKDAILSDAEKSTLIAWAKELEDKLK